MKKLLFSGPVLTASGYGEHARQILLGLVNNNKDDYDIYVRSLKWGATSSIDESDECDLIKSLAKKFEDSQNKEFDISVQVTIPNEFQKLAKLNVGITAGIEVDRVSPAWITNTNNTVDVVVVPSKHSLDTFAKIAYDGPEGEIRLKKPAVVIPEGFNKKAFENADGSRSVLGNIDTKINFLSVGLGLDKAIGEDRKNFGELIKLFCEEFEGRKDVSLVLKLGMVNNSHPDYVLTLDRIRQIKSSLGVGEYPKIRLIHGRLTKQQMTDLYHDPRLTAYVTLTHGEGFGLPILEATAAGLPVIAPGWSGHIDFLSSSDGKRRYVDVNYDLKQIPSSFAWKNVVEHDSMWAVPDGEDFKRKLRKFISKSEIPKTWAAELRKENFERYNDEKIGKDFYEFLQKVVEDVFSDKAKNMRRMFMSRFKLNENEKTLIYTMPMSGGDVFISTAVVNSLRKKHPDAKIFFATNRQYYDILRDNKDIDFVLNFEDQMNNVPLLENVFDFVYTPNLGIQMITSNWVKSGKGRLLGNEMANLCEVPFGNYSISFDNISNFKLPEKYVVFQGGSGKGQWEARNFNRWDDVLNEVDNLGFKVVSIGLQGDKHFEKGVDLRGRTTYNSMASVIRGASAVISIDSMSMHMAAALGIPHVAIFGSSFSTSTGPVLPEGFDKSKSILIDAKNRGGCFKACYSRTCSVNKENPCVNEIEPLEIVEAFKKVMKI